MQRKEKQSHGLLRRRTLQYAAFIGSSMLMKLFMSDTFSITIIMHLLRSSTLRPEMDYICVMTSCVVRLNFGQLYLAIRQRP